MDCFARARNDENGNNLFASVRGLMVRDGAMRLLTMRVWLRRMLRPHPEERLASRVSKDASQPIARHCGRQPILISSWVMAGRPIRPTRSVIASASEAIHLGTGKKAGLLRRVRSSQ